MTETTNLADTLRTLVAQHGISAVLEMLASIMADRGNVTGAIVSEIAAIEAWLQAQHSPAQRQ